VTANVVLVDAGGTNIGSVRYALQRLGTDAVLSSDATKIRSATHVILPGVGAAAPGMFRLRAARLVETLRRLTQPVLGVCLGMQLLFDHSEEDDTECLGIVPGNVRHFPQSNKLRVPHMGWNSVRVDKANPLLDDDTAASRAYFVHGYAAPTNDFTIASTTYGADFAAAVQRDNFFGVQFHPERSSSFGARVLQNFLAL
jgi:imidazole glycerol-phosphate synthase subunit HisH